MVKILIFLFNDIYFLTGCDLIRDDGIYCGIFAQYSGNDEYLVSVNVFTVKETEAIVTTATTFNTTEGITKNLFYESETNAYEFSTSSFLWNTKEFLSTENNFSEIESEEFQGII